MSRSGFRQLSFVVLGLLLFLASDVFAEDCWKCIGRRDPDTIGCSPVTTGGARTCDVKCSGSSCVCKTGEACRDSFSSANGRACGSDNSASVTQLVIADELEFVDGKFSTAKDKAEAGMRINLKKESFDRLFPKSGIVALTLKQSFDEFGSLRDGAGEGIYLSAPNKNGVREMYAYTSEIKTKSDSAIAEFNLKDHPTLTRIVAYIQDNGNRGRISLEHKNGSKSTERW
jgi:hypothetical protein